MGIKVSAGLDQHSSFQKGRQDAHVDINDEESLKKWGEALHLSREELIAAVKEYGPIIRNIRLGIKSRGSSEAA